MSCARPDRRPASATLAELIEIARAAIDGRRGPKSDFPDFGEGKSFDRLRVEMELRGLAFWSHRQDINVHAWFMLEKAAECCFVAWQRDGWRKITGALLDLVERDRDALFEEEAFDARGAMGMGA